MKLTLRRALSFMMVLTMLLSYGAANAAGSDNYPVVTHIDELGATIRLPLDAIYVTLDPSEKDKMVEMLGEDYDWFIRSMKAESMYFYALHSLISDWQVSIRKIAEWTNTIGDLIALAEKLNSSYAEQAVLDSFADNMAAKGVPVDYSYIRQANGHMFLVYGINTDGGYRYMALTVNNKNETLSICVENVEEHAAGSYPNPRYQLRSVIDDIIDGIIFD